MRVREAYFKRQKDDAADVIQSDRWRSSIGRISTNHADVCNASMLSKKVFSGR